MLVVDLDIWLINADQEGIKQMTRIYRRITFFAMHARKLDILQNIVGARIL